jgi:hypothetical protein
MGNKGTKIVAVNTSILNIIVNINTGDVLPIKNDFNIKNNSIII